MGMSVKAKSGQLMSSCVEEVEDVAREAGTTAVMIAAIAVVTVDVAGAAMTATVVTVVATEAAMVVAMVAVTATAMLDAGAQAMMITMVGEGEEMTAIEGHGEKCINRGQ